VAVAIPGFFIPWPTRPKPGQSPATSRGAHPSFHAGLLMQG